MHVYLNSAYPEEFLNDYVPRIVVSSMMRRIGEPASIAMSDALEERYGMSLRDVIEEIANCKLHSAYSDRYVVVGIPANAMTKSGEHLDTIVRFVDHGSTDVKGTMLFTNALNYLRANVLNAYRAYLFFGKSYRWR